MLLLDPLKQLEKDGGIMQPLVILIDALDEAEVCLGQNPFGKLIKYISFKESHLRP